MGEKFGIVSEDGDDPDAILSDLATRTPDVIETVRKQLPANFPANTADSILDGLRKSASQLVA